MNNPSTPIEVDLKKLYDKAYEDTLKLRECLNKYFATEEFFHIQQAITYRQNLESQIVKMERLVRKLKTGKHLLQEMTLNEYYKILDNLSNHICPSLRHSVHIIESAYRKLVLSTSQSTGIH